MVMKYHISSDLGITYLPCLLSYSREIRVVLTRFLFGRLPVPLVPLQPTLTPWRYSTVDLVMEVSRFSKSAVVTNQVKGFGCNNPSLEAYNEVMFMNSERDDAVALLLSVGTGRSRISRYGTGKRASIYAYFKAAKKLASDSEGTHENMSAFSRRGEGFPYYRFNVPDGLSEIKLDDAKRSTLRRMREETEKYIELGVMDDGRTLVRDHLEEVATKLVESRRERAETPQWEMIALGIRYHCPIKACSSGHKIKDTKADLWDHLVTKHGKPRRGVETEQEKGEIEDIIQRGRIEPSLGIAG